MSVLGKWTAKGLPRPAWSNASGAVSYACDLWPRTPFVHHPSFWNKEDNEDPTTVYGFSAL